MPQPRAFEETQEPQQKYSNQNATGKQPYQNQEATIGSPNIPRIQPRRSPKHIPQYIPQQIEFVVAQQPQHTANNQKATRTPAKSIQAATSSWSNIPQHIPPHIPHIYSTTYVAAKSIHWCNKATPASKHTESNQKATRKRPESNQQLAKYPTTYSTYDSYKYSTIYATAKRIGRSTIDTAKSKQQERNQKATNKQP
jgi:hypothetical protein